MVDISLPYAESLLTGIEIEFNTTGDDTTILKDFTVEKVMLGENLLQPGLQTSIVAHSYRQNIPAKNYDVLKNATVSIILDKPILKEHGRPTTMEILQRVYRLENRTQVSTNVEELTLRACDDTMLNDATSTVSKSWKCTTPSEVAAYVLSTCAGAKNLDIESSGPGRDYIAENIHPFQVVAQQMNVALAEGDDPSFLHYMTYENFGTHHFRSLKQLCQKEPIQSFVETETGISSGGMANPEGVMTFSFPCDFDLLSDVLNGVSTNGRDINSLIVFNPVNKMFSLVGDQTNGCGLGSGVVKMAQTNRNTSEQQNSCNSEVEKYLLKRQARMSLLEKDKIALRMTVPFDPSLHVGEVIEFNTYNKEALSLGELLPNYGSGTYLIMSLFHEIRRGGYAITTMDCVSTTVGSGVV